MGILRVVASNRSTLFLYKYPAYHVCRKLHAIHNENQSFYDIIIAGGGMVGTTLACVLGQNPKLVNKSILLLEGSPERQWSLQPTYSNRVSALSPNTKSLLTSIGAWNHISETRCKEVKKMQVWEAYSDTIITFSHDEMNKDIAYIVENDLLLTSVSKQLKSKGKNVVVIHKAKVKSYKLPTRNEAVDDEHIHLELENGLTFSCSLLIGADGSNSKVRKAMGIQYLSWMYNQTGVVATVRLSEPTENVVAWQRFLPTGPVALLPLTDELCSLVWSTSREQARVLLRHTNECFVDALNEALWKQYPKISAVDSTMRFVDSVLESFLLSSSVARQLHPSVISVETGSRAAFPLGFGHSTCYAVQGVVLVGDAAHRIHPLAGQGVNLGFGDVCCLSEILGEAVSEGKAVGTLSHLLKYETIRQRHNVPLMLAIDGLHKLYGSTRVPAVMLRSIGVQFTNALQPIKKAMMNYAAA